MNTEQDFLEKEITDPDQIRTYLNEPIQLRNRMIRNRLLLAPMAGLGHVAFRELVSGFGGYGLLFTGMCSAKAVPHENPRVSTVFRWRPEELHETVCQIFGPDPDSMARAAARIEKEGFFGVDLNFGCSVAAICKKGCGAALLKSPVAAAAIVNAVRKTVSIPVFVKFRTGWEDNPAYAADMAKRFEDAGADALVFHPRVAPDRRSRPPKWSYITVVQKAVTIPVFGNGNLFDIADAAKMISLTGCQGLSLGRIAITEPWIFASWTSEFVPDSRIRYRTAMKMTTLLEKHYDCVWALKLFKSFVLYFCAGFRFGHSIRRQLLKSETMDEARDTIENIFSQEPEILLRPNLNLF